MIRAACSHRSGGPMMCAIFSGPVPSSEASTQSKDRNLKEKHNSEPLPPGGTAASWVSETPQTVSHCTPCVQE